MEQSNITIETKSRIQKNFDWCDLDPQINFCVFKIQGQWVHSSCLPERVLSLEGNINKYIWRVTNVLAETRFVRGLVKIRLERIECEKRVVLKDGDSLIINPEYEDCEI